MIILYSIGIHIRIYSPRPSTDYAISVNCRSVITILCILTKNYCVYTECLELIRNKIVIRVLLSYKQNEFDYDLLIAISIFKNLSFQTTHNH